MKREYISGAERAIVLEYMKNDLKLSKMDIRGLVNAYDSQSEVILEDIGEYLRGELDEVETAKHEVVVRKAYKFMEDKKFDFQTIQLRRLIARARGEEYKPEWFSIQLY